MPDKGLKLKTQWVGHVLQVVFQFLPFPYYPLEAVISSSILYLMQNRELPQVQTNNVSTATFGMIENLLKLKSVVHIWESAAI